MCVPASALANEGEPDAYARCRGPILRASSPERRTAKRRLRRPLMEEVNGGIFRKKPTSWTPNRELHRAPPSARRPRVRSEQVKQWRNARFQNMRARFAAIRFARKEIAAAVRSFWDEAAQVIAWKENLAQESSARSRSNATKIRITAITSRPGPFHAERFCHSDSKASGARPGRTKIEAVGLGTDGMMRSFKYALRAAWQPALRVEDVPSRALGRSLYPDEQRLFAKVISNDRRRAFVPSTKRLEICLEPSADKCYEVGYEEQTPRLVVIPYAASSTFLGRRIQKNSRRTKVSQRFTLGKRSL